MPRSRHHTDRAAAPVAIAAALSAAIVLAACGSSTTPALDMATIEQSIAATIQAQHGLRTTVDCPQHAARKTGTSFTCTASLDVGAYPVHVSVLNDSGRVVYTNATPLAALDTAKVESAIEASILQRTHARAQVNCPAEVLQQDGLTFTCSASGAGPVRTFTVVQRDGGRVRYTET